MRNKVIVALMLVGVLIGTAACANVQGVDELNNVPPAPNKYIATVTAEDFNKEANIVKEVEVKLEIHLQSYWILMRRPVFNGQPRLTLAMQRWLSRRPMNISRRILEMHRLPGWQVLRNGHSELVKLGLQPLS